MLPRLAVPAHAAADRGDRRRALLTLPALLAAGFLAASGCAPAAADDAPKLSTRPLSRYSTQTITTLDEQAALERSQAAIGNAVADFALVNRDGRPVRLADYRGKPLLVNFIYTGCFQVCPVTTQNLRKAVLNLTAKLGAGRFNVVSIGFNQPFDTPQAMKQFAQQQGVALANWDFLSPAPALVPELVKSFGFSYVQTSSGFDHLNQVTLVDGQGRIARQLYGEDFAGDALAGPLKSLLQGETLPAQTVALAEIVDRVRLLCSVYDPITGKYRTDYGVFMEIAGAVTFAVWLAVFYWRERRRAAQNSLGT